LDFYGIINKEEILLFIKMETKNSRDFKICISGLTACGKTTLLKELSRHYKCPHISFSSFLLKQYAANRPDLIPQHKKSDHYWYYAESLNCYRFKSLKIEKQIDKKFYSFITSKKKIVFDSFTYPYLAVRNPKKPFCVLLDVGKKIRLARAIRSSDSLTRKELSKYIDEKDATTNAILKKIWQLDIFRGSYKKYFDLVISDETLEKMGISLKKRLAIKTHIVISFADLYFHKKLRLTSTDKKKLIIHCERLLKKYYPSLIKRYPLFLTRANITQD